MKRALLAVILAACSKVTYVDRTTVPTGVVVSETGHYFLAGLVGHTTLPVYAMCPSGVSRIQSKFTFTDRLVGVLTLGIYTPRTYDVECGR
jgi:Bor protein